MSGEIGRIDPNVTEIIAKCIEQIKSKYPEYGNTWVDQNYKYYKKRLTNEVSEYVESLTVESERRKLLNIINIAAMAYQTAKANRTKIEGIECPHCGESFIKT